MSHLNALLTLIPTLYDPFGLKVMLTVLGMAFITLFIFFSIGRSFVHAFITSAGITTLATIISLLMVSTLSRG